MQSAPCSQSLFEEHALQRTPLPLGALPPSTGVDASDAPLELPDDEDDEDDDDEGGGRGST